MLEITDSKDEKKKHLGLFESELSASEKYNLTLKQAL